MMVDKKYMTSLMQSFLFMCAFLITGNTYADSVIEEKNLQLQVGNYLAVDYIDILKQTKSPVIAGRHAVGRQYIEISFDANERKVYLGVYNFHDSEAVFVSDTSFKNVNDIENKTSTTIKVQSRSEFLIAIGTKMHRYRYVGNLQQYIVRNTVAGKYKDNKGGFYVFTGDGLAIFPSGNFHYKVDPGYVSNTIDNLFEVLPQGTGSTYGFKFDKNELQLFEMGGPMGEEPEALPFVTLTRIEDAGK